MSGRRLLGAARGAGARAPKMMNTLDTRDPLQPLLLQVLSKRGQQQVQAAEQLLAALPASLDRLEPHAANALATTVGVIIFKETEAPSLRAVLWRILSLLERSQYVESFCRTCMKTRSI